MPLSDTDIDAAIGDVYHPAQPAAAAIVGATDSNPDEAAKTLKNSAQQGLPFSAGNLDPQSFNKDAETQASVDASNQDPVVARYLGNYDFAAHVSKDDIPVLARVSPLLQKFVELEGGMFKAAFDAAQTTFGHEPLGFSPENIEKYPLTTSIWRFPAAALDVGMRSIPAAISGVSAAIEHAAVQGGLVTEGERGRFRRDMEGLGLALTVEGVPHAPIPLAHQFAIDQAAKFLPKDPRVVIDIQTYAHANENPHPGVNATIDKVLIEESKNDAENYRDIKSAAAESKTLERSPEAFKAFVEEATQGKTVSIPIDAIDEILKDRAPEAFGWLSDYAEQSERARATGGDINIPLGEWLSGGKDIADQFKDDIRLREDGLTAREADELKKTPPEAYEEPQAPIVKFREEAADIEAGLPPVEEGNVRLYRGNRPGERGTAFTNDLPGIALPFRKMYGGELHYVDVPEADLTKYENKVGTATFAEFNLPQELANKSQVAKKADEPAAVEFKNAQRVAKRELWLRPLFNKPEDLGMTGPQWDAYSKKVQAVAEAADEQAVKFAAKEIAKRQTAEWKEAETNTRKEAALDLSYRPVFLADEFFRSGRLGAHEAPGFKLDANLIEAKYGKETLESLPRSAVTRDRGVDPSDAASLFGYHHGDALINNLELLENARRKAEMSPREYFNDTVERATAERMEQTHGVLSENILAEARNAVGSGGQANLLADEMFALGKQIGLPETFTREWLDREIKRNFDTGPALDARKENRFIRDAGRAGRQAEMALLKGNVEEAFRAKQRQFIAAQQARQARAFAKDFDKTMGIVDRAIKSQEMSGVEQEHFDQLRGMLETAGWENRHPIPEQVPLQEFVDGSSGKLAIAHWLKDPTAKPYAELKDMTVEHFRDLSNSIKSMIHVGRDIQKVFDSHGAADLQNAIFDMKASLDRFNLIDQPLNPSVRQRIGSLERKINAMNLLPERLLDYSDKFDPNGPFNRFIDRPLREANNKEIVLTERIVKMRKALDKYIDNSILEPINNRILPDALARSGFLNMNRGNLRNLIGYMGSESGEAKVINGFLKPEGARKGMSAEQKIAAEKSKAENFERSRVAIWDMIHKNATEEDFRYVNGMHEIFDELYKDSSELEERYSGVPMDKIEGKKYDTKFGEFNGGYWPIFYDKSRSNIEGHLASKGGFFEPTYVTVSQTPHGYTIPRTDFDAPLDLTGARMVSKIQGMVHDIAFREAVNQVSKFINNNEFMTEMNKKWSKEYTGILRPWLKDIANVSKVDDSYAQGFERASAFVRQNIVSALTFLNPGTYIKHTLTAGAMSTQRAGIRSMLGSVKDLVGTAVRMKDVPPEFMDALKAVTDPSETGNSVRQFILDSSPVLRTRQRLYQDTLRGAFERGVSGALIQAGSDIRQTSMFVGRFPIQIGDATSTYPLWYSAYKKAFASGLDHTDAVFVADKEVSRAHGSSAIIDKARILRTGEAMRWVTPLFNFWNHMQNNYLQMRWDIGQAMKGAKRGEAEPGANISSIAGRAFWLVMMPIAIEEMASPALDEDRHSIGHRVLMATIRQAGAGYVGLRDITNGLTGGYEPSVGILSTFYKTMGQFSHDIYNSVEGKKFSKDWFTHLNSALGMATGVSGTQVGKTGTGIKGWFQGTERPQSFDQYRQLFRTGHTKGRIKK